MKRILGLMMAIIMIAGAVPVISYADGTGQGLDAAVDFASEYLETGDNDYRVFGKNYSAQAQTVQTVRALYSGGTLTDVTYGVPFSVAAGEEFAVLETVTVPEGTDVSNSNLKVYLWDNADNFMPLAKEFSQRGVSFEFTLDEAATTSAGVYDKDGRLVRTLWSAVYYDKGTHTGKWDGLDDELNVTDGGEYTIKVMSHNVKYEQDALLANSTAREKADTLMTSYQPISDMTLLGDNMYYADQYMENYYTLMYFNINDIHRKAGYFEKRGNRVPIRNTNDGETVYWMIFETTPSAKYDTSVYGQRRCFIMGVDVASNSQVVYENGEALWDYWGANSATTYESAIGYEPYFESEGVGHYSSSAEVGYCDITVQQQGDFLVATYGNRDFVRIIDKTTGKTLKDNALTAPTAVLFDTQDRLWVAYTDANGAYAVSRFDIAADGTMTLAESAPSANIKGETLAMEFSPDGSYIVFVFGKGSDKMYAYNLSDWSEKWTWGRGEDYSTDSTVYEDKFMFRDTVGGREYSFLEFEGSNYLWVGDPGNDRNHKLYVGGESTPVILDTLWFSKQHYACEVDAGNPERVFFGPKEFKIDYTKEGDESWTLVKNHMDTISPYLTESSGGMFYGITTASNGRTYFAGIVRENAEVSGSQYERSAGDKVVYELLENGIRDTGVIINGWNMLSDGNMTLQTAQKHNLNGVSGTALYRKSLSGFDANGNPVWGEKKMIAFMSNTEGGWNAMSGDTAVTDNGIVFPIRGGYYSNVYRTADNMRDFRMGGFKAEVSENVKWLFRAAPATTANYAVRVFPRDGAVEINTWYDLSGQAKAYGSNVITHYRGEGYLGGQANVFYHYLDNGLLVGVFGAATYQQAEYENYGQELVNGNGFCWQWTFPDGKDSDIAYLYQGGEARMSGVVRMKITGLSSVKIQEIPVTLSSPYRSGVLVTSYSQADLSNTSEINNTIRYDFSLPEDVNANGSVKYETYIKVPEGEEGTLPLWLYSDGNIKAVYDSTELISGSGIVAQNIAVSSDDYKKLTVYVTPKDGTLSYFSLKGEINGVKTDIPTKYFYAIPSVSNTTRSEYSLIEDLPFDSTVSGKMAGWNFENWVIGSSTAVTNAGSYDYMKGSSLTLNGTLVLGESIYAERDLGTARSDMSAWEINTELRMLGIPNGYYEYPSTGGNMPGEQGKYLDILDQSGKIIARITLEDDYTLRLNDQIIMQTDNTLSSLSRNYTHELTTPAELKIYTTDGKITVSYRGNSVTTGVYESGADWKAPKTLKVSAFKNCRLGPHAVTMTTEFVTLDYIQYTTDTQL